MAVSTPSYGGETGGFHKCGTKASYARQGASAKVDVLKAHGCSGVGNVCKIEGPLRAAEELALNGKKCQDTAGRSGILP
jgi:hypothetical protein